MVKNKEFDETAWGFWDATETRTSSDLMSCSQFVHGPADFKTLTQLFHSSFSGRRHLLM
jgi:hypothetical protein